MSIDELMDVASEPHELNIYTATNFSALTENIANRLTDALCNSKHSFTTVLHYCAFVYVYMNIICVFVFCHEKNMFNSNHILRLYFREQDPYMY